jgi:hypothetical protein
VTAFKLVENGATRRFEGFGAQYNQNVYAMRSRDVGVTPENVTVMEQRMTELAPHLVRVFFNADAFDDADLMQSFRTTVGLAQSTGRAINITLQGLGPVVLAAHPRLLPLFAEELARLITDDRITKLKWVTLRNEPNNESAPMDKQLYAKCYRDFDSELRGAGIRSKLGLMGGDLLLPNQKAWFKFLADNLAGTLDAYSIHVYWDFSTPKKIRTRLTGVDTIRKSLPRAVREKPFYVMECGARGNKTHNSVTEDPGFWTNGARIATTKVNAFQRAWFALEAVKQGFCGVVAWDAYCAKYDKDSMMHYSMVGGPSEDEAWPKRPAFRALRLLMRAVEPGWKVLEVEGESATQCVVGFRSDGDPRQWTVAGLDTAGAKLNAASPKQSSYTIGGLPKNTRFQLCFWNLKGDGLNTFDDEARSDDEGNVPLTVPRHSMFVLTTRAIS